MSLSVCMFVMFFTCIFNVSFYFYITSLEPPENTNGRLHVDFECPMENDDDDIVVVYLA